MKYEKGKQVTSITMFDKLVPTTKYWKWFDKTVQTGQLLNFTYRRLKNCIDRGAIWTARTIVAKEK